MGRRRVALAVLAVLLAATAGAARGHVAPPTEEALARDVAALTAPGMDGRASGTPGGERAARLLAGWLEAAGLVPGGDRGTFLQSFVLSTGAVQAPGNQLEVTAPASLTLGLDNEWRPHGGSVDGEVRAPLVFVGHGVAHGAWDDYHGVNPTGKVVMMLDGLPDALRGQVVTRAEKLITARRRGAVAVLVVGDPLPSLAATAAPVRVISAALTRSAADRLLAPAGRSLAALERDIAARGAPVPVAVEMRLRVALAREERHAVNVVGVLPGTDPIVGREAIVVGAHYDHLGVLGGQVHPGADDNASGTALVVNLARAFAAGPPPRRTLVFALFGAEELGLIGSGHYVRQPTVPLERTVAMINLDMVGRLRNHLTATGLDSGRDLRALVSEAATAAGVPVRLEGDPWAPSDHVRFYRAGVPVVFFTTGTHDDYHRPTDQPDRLAVDGMVRVATVAGRVIQGLAEGARPSFVELPLPSRGGSAGGPFLGVVADGQLRDGVRLADVVPDSAAHRAGLREGDIIVRMDDIGIDGFDALRRAIARRRPGTAVEILYLRDGADHRARATLGVRP